MTCFFTPCTDHVFFLFICAVGCYFCWFLENTKTQPGDSICEKRPPTVLKVDHFNGAPNPTENLKVLILKHTWVPPKPTLEGNHLGYMRENHQQYHLMYLLPKRNLFFSNGWRYFLRPTSTTGIICHPTWPQINHRKYVCCMYRECPFQSEQMENKKRQTTLRKGTQY